MISKNPKGKKPIAIDLFSGCGGLSLGLRQAGFKVIGAVELDALAVETFKANHKRVRVWETDIRKLRGNAVLKELKLEVGELDLLAGCPPCQGFSTMTTLNGSVSSMDPRNDLIFQFLRFVRVLKPKAIMMENVPGLGDDFRLEHLVSALERMNYKVNCRVLNASEFGVPQRRRRFILLAGKGDEIFFGTPNGEAVTVRKAFAKLRFRPKNDLLHRSREKRSEKVKKLIRLIPKDGGSRKDLKKSLQLPCHRRCDGFNDVYGRMAWDRVAPTITGGCCNPSKGRFLHPSKHRTITLREAALLQSFPPSYQISLKRGKFLAAQMIGNAVPPLFSKMQALSVLQFLGVFHLRSGVTRK